MTVKQFPALGLIFALFFGARTANRNELPLPAPRAPRAVKNSQPPPKTKAAPRSVRPVAAGTDEDCNNTLTAKLQQRWWLSRSTHGCSLTVAPVWREICKINPSHQSSEKSFEDAADEEQFKKRCLGDPAAIQSMMAAVPNPRRTHLGLMTDRSIEAIQVAASEAHFLPLAHYLPWPPPGSTANAADAAEEETHSESGDPGVLIFQDAIQPSAALCRPTYLLVFLIPETPTEGLDRGVFLKAGGIIKQISRPQDDVIRFVGPNFSGSVAALEDLQKTLADRNGKEGPAIHAVSGSVTNADNIDKRLVKFTATQTGDHEALCLFVKHARKFFHYGKNEIAILSEEGTQYGRQGPEDRGLAAENAGTSADQTQSAKSPVAKPDAKDESEENCNAQNDRDLAGLWFLHFPREISKLRNAYGAEVGKSAPSDPNSSPDLGLQWQDTEASQRDDLQTYGDRQTPLSQEAVLSSLSITLKAQGIKALGILATDPMDEAFLIHSIKRSSPDVRLFLRDPDLLFLRTPDVGSLNGTLLVSNYPLVPENQFWSSNVGREDRPKGDKQSSVDQHLITFPSAFQEGEYNAFVQLLAEANWAPRDMQTLEWEWPAGMAAKPQEPGSRKPQPGPLWLATIGTAGHYPIEILNNDPSNDPSLASQLKLHSLNLGPPQFLPIAFWTTIAILGLLHSVGLKVRGAVPATFRHDFDLSDKASTVTLVKLMCHEIAILTIALAQFVIGSSYLFFWRSGWRYTVLAGLVVLVTLYLLGTAAAIFGRIYKLARQQQQLLVPDDAAKILGPKRIVRSGLICGLILVIAGACWTWLSAGNRFDNAFLHFRDLNLSSGVAPTLPLASVLLVLYFGIWGYLRRLSYWEHRYVEIFNLKMDLAIHQEFSDDVKAIDTCLLGPLENHKWLMGMALAFGLSMVALRPLSTLDMIEPYRVSIFAVVFLAFALLSLWLNWFRFINIWVHLQNILDRLENLPIHTAFQRLPKEKSLPILQWSSPQNSFLLRQVLDRLRALARADPTAMNVELERDFEKCMDALTSHGVVKMRMMERRVVGGSRLQGAPVATIRREDHLHQARQQMTKTTEILSLQLNNQFWNRGSSSTEQEQKVDPADLKYLLAEDIVALPFYAYIQKVISEMRNILFFLGIAISLLFAALHTYSFRADQAIDWWFFGLFISMGLGIVFVIAQMERNALVSRLSDNKTPGELSGNFYLQLLKYGMVPILTIFGSQIPSISNLVLKWVQPALEALH